MEMNIKTILISLVLILVTGCASTGNSRQGQIERITPEELALLLPSPIATYTLEALVVDAKKGKTPDEMIAKIKESESRYELTSSQVLDLNNKVLIRKC